MSAAITRYFYGAYSANRPCRQLLPATFMAPIPQIDHFGSYYPLPGSRKNNRPKIYEVEPEAEAKNRTGPLEIKLKPEARTRKKS